MSKRLILMRHADSPRELKTTDYQRHLSEKGKAQATQMGVYLREKGWIPDAILVSSAKRTRETAEILCTELGISPEKILPNTNLYGAPAKKIMENILSAEIPEAVNTLLVIAHNPGISDLAMECDPNRTDHYFCPAGMAGFNMEEIAWDQMKQEKLSFSFAHEPKAI